MRFMVRISANSVKFGDNVKDVHIGGFINFSGRGGVGGLGEPNGELLPPPLPVVVIVLDIELLFPDA